MIEIVKEETRTMAGTAKVTLPKCGAFQQGTDEIDISFSTSGNKGCKVEIYNIQYSDGDRTDKPCIDLLIQALQELREFISSKV